MTLIAFPLPIDGESATGYFFRLARENLFDDPGKFYKSVFNRQNYLFSRICKEELATITGHSLECFDSLWLTFADDFYLFRDVVVPKHHVVKQHRWCPLCWSENRIIKSVWEIGWLPFCDQHEVLLMDQCSECGDVLRYANHQVACRQCGTLLEEMKPQEGPPAVLRSQRKTFKVLWEPARPRDYTLNPAVQVVSRHLNTAEERRRSSKADGRAAPRAHYWLSVAETVSAYEQVLAGRIPA